MEKRTNDQNKSFLEKILRSIKAICGKIKAFRLFEEISDRQKRLAGYAGNAPTNDSRIAYGLGVAKTVFICLFVAVAVTILLFAGRIISYENVYYMFKDIGYISSYGESRPEALNYSKPLNNQYFTDFNIFPSIYKQPKNGLSKKERPLLLSVALIGFIVFIPFVCFPRINTILLSKLRSIHTLLHILVYILICVFTCVLIHSYDLPDYHFISEPLSQS